METNMTQTVEAIEAEQTMETTEAVLATELTHPFTAAQIAGFNKAIIEKDLRQEAKRPKPFGVHEHSVCIYTNDWGYSVYVLKLECGAMQKVGFTVVDAEGKPRGTVTTTHSRLTDKNGFKFMMDFVGDFQKLDTDEIGRRFGNVWQKLKPVRADDRVSFDVVYAELSETEEKADIVTKTHTKDGDYINIAVGKFKQIVEEGDWGWKPLEVKRQLRDLGLLRVNKDRPFDYTVVDSKGTPYRTISIRLNMNGGEADKR